MRSMLVLLGALILGCGGDTTQDDAAMQDAPAATGCAMGGAACTGGLMCCSGVPYPAEGVCAVTCDRDSDRALKERFVRADEEEVLERLASLPIYEWSYRRDPETRHLGPTAQEFHAAFGVGADDRHIHSLDGDGVALAAIRALNRRVEALEQENVTLRSEVEELRRSR